MRRDEEFSRRTIGTFVCLGLLLAVMPVRLAYGQSLASGLVQARANRDSNAPLDQAQQWKWMQSSLKSAGVSKPKLEDGLVTGTINGKTPFAIRLAMVTSATAPVLTAIPFGQAYSVHWYEFPNVSSGPGTLIWSGHWAPVIAFHDAEHFQSALIYLARAIQDDQDAKLNAWLEDFKPKAEAWRQMKVKPAMPEEAHEHQVLAEYAYKQKDIPKAMNEFAAALQIFPYWPDGQYNLATMASEIGGRPGYRNAIFHMECFLALAPDSPDAETASDSVIVWKDKMTNGSRSPSPASTD
ncbi:MAG: tetratricopeptide repeat protein [Acidobacteriaceae bacterium]